MRTLHHLVIFNYLTIASSFHSFYGALLLIQCRSAHTSDLSWLFIIAMLCDIIETGTFYYAANRFPDHISSTIIRAASIANEMKWITFGGGFIGVVGLLLRNSFSSKAHKQ